MKDIQDYKNRVLEYLNGLQMKGSVCRMIAGNRTQTHGMELGVQRTPTFSYHRATLTNEYTNTGTNSWVSERRNEPHCPRRKWQVSHCHSCSKTGRFSTPGDRWQNHMTKHNEITFGLNLGTWNSHPVHSDQLCLHGMALPTPSMPPLSLRGGMTFWLARENILSMQDESSNRRTITMRLPWNTFILPHHSLSHVIPPLKVLKSKVLVFPNINPSSYNSNLQGEICPLVQ